MHDLLPALGPWFVCAVAVVLGTVLQRLSGAGFGMIAAPLMTIAAPAWVPGTILLLGLAVGLGAFFGARDAVTLKDLPPGLIGRVFGAAIAAMIASVVVGSHALPDVVACIVLFAVALSLAGLSVPITKTSLFGAGVLGAIMGTLTGIGGAPMAMLYATVDARRSAATQNAFYGLGTLISIAALAVSGLIRMQHIALALSLAPLVPLSLWISRPLARHVERGSIRPWALWLATVSAVLLLVAG